jgi:GH24 family phage-related lysozyme (muramidase)
MNSPAKTPQKPKTFLGVALVAVLAISVPFAARWEGDGRTAYFDRIGNVITWCFGQTGPSVAVGQRFTQEYCDQLLVRSQSKYAERIDACIVPGRPVSPFEAAMILDLGYNAGVSAVCRSTLARQLRAGASKETTCPQLMRWVWSSGKDCRDPKNKCSGLPMRRSEALNICLKG